MKIIFTDTAKKHLKSIYQYYRKEASLKVAKSIKDNILTDIGKLKNHPQIGSEETFLSPLKQEYKKLVTGNYKVIYRIVDNYIVIDTLFDTRQEPKELLKKLKR